MAGSRNGGIQLLEGILQTVQDGIDLFTCDDQRRLDANDARVIERTGYKNTPLEEARSDGIADIIIHKVLTNQQAFTRDVCIYITMARGNLFQLLNKVFTLFSSLFWNALFKSNINGSDGGSTSKRITPGGRGMNKGIAVHHTPYFRSGHKGTDRHDAAAKGLSCGDNIGRNIPVLNSPELASTSHTG